MMSVDEEIGRAEFAIKIEQRLAEPEEIAIVLVFLLSEKVSFVMGTIYSLM
jgi:NAD(P)-dependent dehydrogenase (short-subunit alcohol dehydrogenase family)